MGCSGGRGNRAHDFATSHSTTLHRISNYTDAKAEWQRALREADGDPETARGLLLARVALELEAQRPMLKALSDSARPRTPFGRRSS